MKFFLLIFLQGWFLGVLSAQNIQIKGFQNVDLHAVFDSVNRTHFALGQLDLFFTSQITDKLSFLGETVFKYENDFNIGVERAILNYDFKDYINLSAGKLYSPLGYWNNAFHKGLVLQPTINRPVIVSEGVSGGGLPLEELGMQLNGEGITKMNFGYNFSMANGMASNPINDFNKSKSLCLNLHAEPVEDLKFYLSGYADDIPSGTTTMQGIKTTQNINLLISNASIVYRDGKFPMEFIGEYYHLRTTMTDSNITASSNGYFFYLGCRIKKINITPYLFYEGLDLNRNDALFFKNNISEFACGLRYSIHPRAVVKLEYKYSETTLIKFQNRLDLQFAVGF